MVLFLNHKETNFGIGDRIKVFQNIKEGEKKRSQAFEGIVIKIKGEEQNKSFTVRRLGEAQIGIERIFPLKTPTIDKIEVTRSGTKGVRRAKLYFIRNKSKREIDKIYSRTGKKGLIISPKKPSIFKKKNK